MHSFLCQQNEVNARNGLIRRLPYFLISFPDLFLVGLFFGCQTSLSGLFEELVAGQLGEMSGRDTPESQADSQSSSSAIPPPSVQSVVRPSFLARVAVVLARPLSATWGASDEFRPHGLFSCMSITMATGRGNSHFDKTRCRNASSLARHRSSTQLAHQHLQSSRHRLKNPKRDQSQTPMTNEACSRDSTPSRQRNKKPSKRPTNSVSNRYQRANKRLMKFR